MLCALPHARGNYLSEEVLGAEVAGAAGVAAEEPVFEDVPDDVFDDASDDVLEDPVELALDGESDDEPEPEAAPVELVLVLADDDASVL